MEPLHEAQTARHRCRRQHHSSSLSVTATLSLLIFALFTLAVMAQSAATLQGRSHSEVAAPSNLSAASRSRSSTGPLRQVSTQAKQKPTEEETGGGGAGHAADDDDEDDDEEAEYEEDDASEISSAVESSSAKLSASSTRASQTATLAVTNGNGTPSKSHHQQEQHQSKAHSQRTGRPSTGSHKQARASGTGQAKPAPETDIEEDSGADTRYRNDTLVEDLFGNMVKVEGGKRVSSAALKHKAGNTARDLGMFAFKALLLGPLIGITLKGALIRGLIWSMITYAIHLTFPALLATLGLGTGLVGFARQLQPEYTQLLLPQLAQLPQTFQHLLPQSVTHMTNQYFKVFAPVIESISSIPEESCRHRAVCEVASYLIQNSPFMSNSLQRISATVYVNFGTDYSKAWLDGIVQSDCALKYSQCPSSPFSVMASKLVEALRSSNLQNMASTGANAASGSSSSSSAAEAAASSMGQAAVSHARNFFSF